MDSTRSVRQGQIEVGIIEHNGHQFSAYASMTCGRQVNGYLKYKCGRYWLTRWSGEAMLYRGEIVERFWNGAFAIMFRLPKKRFLVGYGLGDGMLFRGELIDNCTDDDARRYALQLSDNWAELDAEDEEAELTAV